MIDWSKKKSDTLDWSNLWRTIFVIDSAYATKVLNESQRVLEGRFFYIGSIVPPTKLKIIENVGALHYFDNKGVLFIGYYNINFVVYGPQWAHYPTDSDYFNDNQKISFENPNQCDLLSSTSAIVRESLSLWPNPAESDLHIDVGLYDGKDVLIFDSNGSRVKEKRIEDGRINVSDLKSGVYILKVKGSNNPMRFVKL